MIYFGRSQTHTKGLEADEKNKIEARELLNKCVNLLLDRHQPRIKSWLNALISADNMTSSAVYKSARETRPTNVNVVLLPESARMGRFTQIALLLAIFALASGDLVRHGRRGRRLGGRRQRQGRQEAEESAAEIQGGVDFTDCTNDEETGLCCIEKEETIKTIQKVRPKRLNLKLKRLNQNDYLIKDRKQIILK